MSVNLLILLCLPICRTSQLGELNCIAFNWVVTNPIAGQKIIEIKEHKIFFERCKQYVTLFLHLSIHTSTWNFSQPIYITRPLFLHQFSAKYLGSILPTKILCSEKFSVKIRKLWLHQIFHKSLKNFLEVVLPWLTN